MLATLAIINMAVAGVLISDTIDDSNAQQEQVAIVATVDTAQHSTDYISWAEE